MKFGEVLAGQAVFVYDPSTENNHIGKTPDTVTDDNNRYFDFVQELLNQVVPRKRILNDVEGSIAGGIYSLVTEDGKYGLSTRAALQAFKTNFGMAARPFGNTVVSFRITNNQVVYEPADDTAPIFRKLTKDYNHRTDPNAAEPYLHQIIDQGTLVGTRDSDQDVYINGIPVNMVNDTGLFELYRNVVQKFVEYQIILENSYRLKSDPANALHQWTARTGQVIQTSAGVQQAISYCYGGRQTVSEFNSRVSKHGAPHALEINNENSNQHGYYRNYNSNLGDALPNEMNQMWVDHGILGQGNKMWPGLYKKSPAPELFEEYASGTTTNEAAHKAWFEWEKWAGIDCEGLALHGLRYAYRPEVYATEQQVEEQNTEIPGIVIGDVCNSANCAIKLPILSDGWQGALLNINVTKFFNPANTGFLYQWQRTEDSQKLIHKGDFAHYDGHISTVYSERWGKTIFNTRDYPNINYDVIHAYGNSLYHQDFSRKVIITGNDIIIPIGFGRIKLWN